MNDDLVENADLKRLWVITHRYPTLEETFINTELSMMADHLHIRVLNCNSEKHIRGETDGRIRVVNLGDQLTFSSCMRIIARVVTSPLRSLRVLLVVVRLLSLVPMRDIRDGTRGFLSAIIGSDTKIPGPFYCHYLSISGVAALMCSAWSAKPFIASAHAVDIYTAPPRYLRYLARKAAAIHSCTQLNCRYLRRVTGVQVLLVHHGVTTSALSRSPLGDSGSPIRLITVGRLVEKKGHADLLTVAADLKAMGVVFDWSFVGAGPLESSLKSLTVQKGLDGFVHWIGPLSHGETLNLVRSSDVFVYRAVKTKNGNRDGIPNVLIEAVASGTAVFTSAFAGSRELMRIGGNRSGLRIAPQKLSDWASKILEYAHQSRADCCCDPSFKETLLREFSWGKSTSSVLGQVEKLYR